MGNETSFQSFPAHVHNILSQKFQEAGVGTHVVHTKIYPRYKSRNKIEVARDAFSAWLTPHEDANSDIILLGHSLGGILSAEVVLKPAFAGEHRQHHHRILGTINFDTPFLGMHPGVISSGLGSLFRPTPAPPAPDAASAASTSGNLEPGPLSSPAAVDISEGRPESDTGYVQSPARPSETLSATTSTSTLPLSSLDFPIHDANYDPSYPNDVRLPQRSGWANIWHFLNKHTDGATLTSKSKALSRAAKSLVTSHLEFGGCLADYYGLRARYKRLKDLDREHAEERFRFVNYYTVSTGRPKKVKAPQDSISEARGYPLEGHDTGVEGDLEDVPLQLPEEDAALLLLDDTIGEISGEQIATNSTNRHNHLLNAREASQLDEMAASDASSIARMSPAPVADSDEEEPATVTVAHDSATEVINQDDVDTIHTDTFNDERPPQPSQSAIVLPPISALPDAPPPFDSTLYTDKETRKLAEKEHLRSVKNHERLVKDRERAINDRKKLIEKREAALKKEQEKRKDAEEKELAKADADAKKKIKDAKKAEKEKGKESSRGKNDQADAEMKRLAEEAKRVEREAQRLNGGSVKDEAAPLAQRTATTETETSSNAAAAAAAAAAADQNDGALAMDDNNINKSSSSSPPQKAKEKEKDRKFCILPDRDPNWIRVFMPGVDEVGAHCGLFTVDGARYEWFVGDVAGRVEDWLSSG